MTRDARGAGSYLIVYSRDGSCCRCVLQDEQALDAAVTAYLDSGKTKDRLVTLTAVSGATYRVLASDVTSWLDSTPETREADTEFESALKDESPAEPWNEGD